MRVTSSPRWPRERACREGQATFPVAEMFQDEIQGMRAGNIHRHRKLTSRSYVAAGNAEGGQKTGGGRPFWMGGGGWFEIGVDTETGNYDGAFIK